MDFFSSLLAQGGEKSFLQNIGIAAGESNVTKKLMDVSKEEKKEARLARKELLNIDDQELANMAAVSGVTKQQKQAEVNAEIETLGDRIKKAELMQSRKKEIADVEKKQGMKLEILLKFLLIKKLLRLL
jgi:tRNA U34 5-carboxymethylaminomethyl modifying enzyme MnmG/GidA